MRRFALAALAAALVLGSLAPAALAAEAQVSFQGVGVARALDLSVPALNALPVSAVQNFTGLTVGATFAQFNGIGSARAVGQAIGHCGLLPSAVSLPVVGSACSQESMEVSASDADNGDGQARCQNLGIGIVNLATSCANSRSFIDAGRPAGSNQGGVAEVNIGLDLALLKSLGLPLDVQATKDQVVNTVVGLVNQVVATVPAVQQLTGTQVNDLVGKINTLLDQIIKGTGKLATIKVGLATTDVTNQGVVTTVTSTAMGAKIGLLGIADALSDGLVIIDVSAAKATALWNDATGQAEAFATPAIATIKVKDLLGLVNPGGYITASVEAPALMNVLAPLNGTPLETTIELASATPKQVGQSVSAATSGVGIHALKGLGASSLGATDGGLSLRLASASVSMSGDIVKAETVSAPLPLTGGPTHAYIALAAILAVGAPMFLRTARRVRASA